MDIRIKLNYALQPYAGNRETVEVTGSTVKECLDNLIASFPVLKEVLFTADGSLAALVSLDGETIMPNDLDRLLADKSTLLLAPMIHGG